MYNRMPRAEWCRIVAPVPAVLTTRPPLLTARAAAGRVHGASRPVDKECSMTNVQWKDPARRAHRFTPIETKAGQPCVARSIHQDSPRVASG